MFKLYILYSTVKDRFYVGFTADILAERIRKHNSNHKGFTGKTGNWELRYSESYDNKESALHREREIKAWKSRKKNEQLIRSAGLEHSDL